MATIPQHTTASGPAPVPVPSRQPDELRIALVMNGGVSLAVWIGGVTAEYARLMAAGRRLGEGAAAGGVDAVYDGLVRLIGLAPRIDVIAGTSAGGVNAAYLGAAIARTTTADELTAAMAGLREVWIGKGAITALLRHPADGAAPSLLDGDGYYYATLHAALARVAARTAAPGAAAAAAEPLHLTLTTTLMTGEPQPIADDYGTSVPDISYRARFCFVRGTGRDDFAGDAFVSQLALAARATSSFPGAFEPVFCPIAGGDAAAVPPAGRAFMDDIALDAGGAPLRRSRYVIDGGVLDNKPLDVAIAAITALPAAGRAARVLAYVAPDPGDAAVTPPAAAMDDPPEVLRVVADALVTIPMAQGVSNQINALRAHNAAVRGRRLDRSAIAGSLCRADLFGLAAMLIGAYRQRRFTRLADEAIEAINVQLSRWPERQPMVAGGRQRAQVTAALAALFDSGRLLIADAGAVAAVAPAGAGVAGVAGGGPAPAAVPAPGPPAAAAGPWRWGHRAVVHIGWLAYDLLVRFERLHPRPPGETAGLWTALCAAQAAAEAQRAETAARWYDARLPRSLDALAQGDAGPFTQLALTAIGDGVAEAQPGGALATLALDIARVVADLAALADAAGVTAGAGAAGAAAGAETAGAAAFARLLALVAPRGAGGTMPAEGDILAAMLAWHVVDDTLGGGGALAEEDIRFIQVSGNDDEVIAGARRRTSRPAPAKLCSVQLGAFAGFYRQSWRAKDWTWGRRDAVGRILRVLLDPQRLREAGATAQAVWTVVTDARTAAGIAADAVADAAISAELACLAPGGAACESLPQTIRALADALETLILVDEFPAIIQAVAHDVGAKTHISEPLKDLRTSIDGATARLAAAPDGLRALARGLVMADDTALCAEPWTDELGSDAATLTAAQGLAVAINVIARASAPLPWLASAILPLRRGTGLLYIFARGNVDGARGMLNVCFGVLLVSLTLILSRIAVGAQYGAVVMTGAYVGFAASYLAIALSSQVKWTRRWAVLLLAAVALAVAGLGALYLRIPPPRGCQPVTRFGACSPEATLRHLFAGPLLWVALGELLVGIGLLAWPLRGFVAHRRRRRALAAAAEPVPVAAPAVVPRPAAVAPVPLAVPIAAARAGGASLPPPQP